jgi:hypothetical protein
VHLVLFLVYYVLLLVTVVVYSFADRCALDDINKNEVYCLMCISQFYLFVFFKNPCPELQRSFPNQLTFWWFTQLAIAGHKRPLDANDLWSLNQRDSSRRLVDIWKSNWLPAVSGLCVLFCLN